MPDCRSLAKSAGLTNSIKSSYIVFFTKMQKGQSPKMRFAFLISENTMFLKLCWPLIYCSYGQFNPKELGCMKSRVLVFSSQIFERSIKRISYQNHFPRQVW